MNHNDEPTNIYDALRRFYRCNRQQLAERLGISARTLQRYERGQAPARETDRARHILLHAATALPAHEAPAGSDSDDEA